MPSINRIAVRRESAGRSLAREDPALSKRRERLRHAVDEHVFCAGTHDLRLTVSVVSPR